MSSIRQVAANRRNARKSTGPRTAAGCARSSKNAIRHGLCVPPDRDFQTKADRLGTAIAHSIPSQAYDFVREQAMTMAAAELELARVRKMRKHRLAGQFQNVDGPESIPSAELQRFLQTI